MKQAIIVINDLKMPKGKLAAQVAHASSSALLKSNKRIIEEWQTNGMKKIVLKVQNKKELIDLKKLADSKGLITALIKDAGNTFFQRATITCLGIGPAQEAKIDEITSELKLV